MCDLFHVLHLLQLQVPSPLSLQGAQWPDTQKSINTKIGKFIQRDLYE